MWSQVDLDQETNITKHGTVEAVIRKRSTLTPGKPGNDRLDETNSPKNTFAMRCDANDNHLIIIRKRQLSKHEDSLRVRAQQTNAKTTYSNDIQNSHESLKEEFCLLRSRVELRIHAHIDYLKTQPDVIQTGRD